MGCGQREAAQHQSFTHADLKAFLVAHTHMLLSRMHQADMFPESARYFFSGASSKTFKTISLHYFTVEEVQGNKAAKRSVAHLIADGKEHNDDDIAGLQREYASCFVSRASILFAGSRKT